MSKRDKRERLLRELRETAHELELEREFSEYLPEPSFWSLIMGAVHMHFDARITAYNGPTAEASLDNRKYNYEVYNINIPPFQYARKVYECLAHLNHGPSPALGDLIPPLQMWHGSGSFTYICDDDAKEDYSKRDRKAIWRPIEPFYFDYWFDKNRLSEVELKFAMPSIWTIDGKPVKIRVGIKSAPQHFSIQPKNPNQIPQYHHARKDYGTRHADLEGYKSLSFGERGYLVRYTDV